MSSNDQQKSSFERSGRGKNAPAGLIFDRPQPHDLATERAVLSALLRDPEGCVDEAIGMLGSGEAFYSQSHRKIFEAVVNIRKENQLAVDAVTVARQLSKDGSLETIGGVEFIADIYNAVATTVNFESWLKVLKEFSVLRDMINVCSGALANCYEADIDAKNLIAEIERQIFAVRNKDRAGEIVTIQESISEAFQQLMDMEAGKIEIGIETGFPDLDKFTGGLKRGEMFVLAARPSIGKTSLALNIISNIAIRSPKPRRVAFFSLEMTSDQISRRILCTESQIPESRFWERQLRPDELPRLSKAAGDIAKAKIWIDPTAGISIAELRAKARRLKQAHDIELVVVDYLQLMKAGTSVESRQQEVAEISSGLKALAKDLNVPVLALAQLNREVDRTSGGGGMPKLSNLRESGAIEQDADVVTFLHRDRDETKHDAAKDQEVRRNGVDAKLIVEKNRNGQTGIVNLRFFPHRMEFVNASRYSDEDRPPGV